MHLSYTTLPKEKEITWFGLTQEMRITIASLVLWHSFRLLCHVLVTSQL